MMHNQLTPRFDFAKSRRLATDVLLVIGLVFAFRQMWRTACLQDRAEAAIQEMLCEHRQLFNQIRVHVPDNTLGPRADQSSPLPKPKLWIDQKPPVGQPPPAAPNNNPRGSPIGSAPAAMLAPSAVGEL